MRNPVEAIAQLGNGFPRNEAKAMSRFILIDHWSGYVFGDTADLSGAHVIDGHSMRERGDGGLTPTLAAQWLDESELAEYGRTYVEHANPPAGDVIGYHIYRADAGGADAVGVIGDGQDRGTIEAVERSCERVAFVEILPERAP